MTPLELLVGVERTAPTELLRQLRVIDPSAELIYMGHGRWLLGRVLASRPIRAAGERLAGSCARVLQTRWRKAPLAADHHRYRTAQLRLRDFQATQEYVVQGEPTGAIVRDQEVMDFLYRHVSEQQLDEMADEPKVAQQAAARADLADDRRAADAWRYLFTRSHSVTRHESDEQKARSGFQIIRRIA
ncbi:MAG: hypothetical protein JWO56_3644 [Acidobacteria bacterium]|nr:hypothetical protein [Acidobacteriota bacterium]